jgi:hypothetical protein
VDDDLNISEPWWANSSKVQQGETYTYYDFYGNESGNMPEQEGNPPSGMWGGHIRFGPENQSQNWEQSPDWNIKSYNGTQMILEKNSWSKETDKTLALTFKVFDFSQNPLSGATVSLDSLMRFGGGQPFAILSDPADYSLVQTQNTTDSNGFAMLKLEPASTWLSNAEYIASITVTYGGETESIKEWIWMGG